MTNVTRYPLTILTGLALVGALAACSAPAETEAPPAPEPDANTDTDTDAPEAAGAYADGTYTESGEYQAPSGTESVDVTITLEGDVITAVEVVGGASDPQAKQHQGEFIDGIAAVVVGKDIDDIQVDKVGGSSLTSGGFNRAVDAIKADAAA